MILRFIIRIHRYLGVLLSLLLLLWSLSGVVMIYADFPSYSDQERRAELEPLKLEACKLSPGAAIEKADLEKPLRSMALRMQAGEPFYYLRGDDGGYAVIDAQSGEAIDGVDRDRALEVVQSRMEEDEAIGSVQKLEARDQWTPQQNYKAHLPLFKIPLDDPEGTVCYVSSRTGELVQKHTFKERVLAWTGPIPHWLYFRDLRVERELWIDTVIVLASVGAFMCVLGLLIGFYRFRKRKKDERLPRSVYKRFWFKWHHYIGFIFGLFLFTWTLSGALSLDPFSYHDPLSLSKQEERAYRKGGLEADAFSSFERVLKEKESKPKEIRFKIFDGKEAYLLYDEEGLAKVLLPGSKKKGIEPMKAKIREGIERLHSEASIVEDSLLESYDNYYYAQYGEKPLPVYRLQIDDEKRSSYYADPRSGAIRSVMTRSGRADRWLYHGLHSLDFPGLYQKRPLWDIVLILLLLGTILLSGTGVVLAGKWGIRKFKQLKGPARGKA